MALSKMHMRVLMRGQLGLLGPAMSEEPAVGRRGQYGWEGPNRPDKGHRAGSCNRTACQAPGAFWWNRGSRSWYCTRCARLINGYDEDPLCVLDEEARKEFYEHRA